MEIFEAVNWFDLVVLLILVRGVFLGVKNGLTAELFRFIGTVLSLTLAVQWYSQAADMFIVNLGLLTWLSQFLCFVIIVQLVRVVFKYGLVMLLKVLNIQFILQLEKIGGGLIGLGRAVLTSGILVLVLSFIPSEYIKESVYDKSFSGLFLAKAMQRTYKSVVFWIDEDKVEESIFEAPATGPKVIKKR